MISLGRMTEAGLVSVEEAKRLEAGIRRIPPRSTPLSQKISQRRYG